MLFRGSESCWSKRFPRNLLAKRHPKYHLLNIPNPLPLPKFLSSPETEVSRALTILSGHSNRLRHPIRLVPAAIPEIRDFAMKSEPPNPCGNRAWGPFDDAGLP